MTRLIPFLLFLAILSPLAADTELRIPDQSRQAVVVVNSHWDATQAHLHRFERKHQSEPWKSVGRPVLVNLGRTGLAWGKSPLMVEFTPPQGEGEKREGDGRSPAGIFPILRAFGHPSPPPGYSNQNLPYLDISDEQCVDDKTSKYYNQIVRPKEVGGVTWSSAERMKISLYQLGLVVGHNCPKAKSGYGSCIFFHLQRGIGKATAGCTSMDDRDLQQLVLWLKKDKNPVVVQLPRKEYAKRQLGLPRL